MSASKTYSRRLFLTYHALIESGPKDLDGTVEKFAAANKDVDLEQPLTFAQWNVEMTPKTKAAAAQ